MKQLQVTLASRILLLIAAIHTHIVLLLPAATKVLQCLIKLYFKTQGTTRFITLHSQWPLVVPVSMVALNLVSPVSMVRLALSEINFYRVMLLLISDTFSCYLLVTGSCKDTITNLQFKKLNFKTQGSKEFIMVRPLLVPWLHSGATAHDVRVTNFVDLLFSEV